MTAAAAVELDGYPFAPKTVEVNGHVMSYVDEGDPDAPPVLLVHGNPTWSFYYRSLLRSLPGLGRDHPAPEAGEAAQQRAVVERPGRVAVHE